MEPTKTLYVYLRRVFGLSPTEVTPEFPPSILDLATWSNLLLELYTEESARGASSRERIVKQHIVELQQYRKYSAPEHEYIVTRIINGGSYQYLRFEHSAKLLDAGRPIVGSTVVAPILTTNDTTLASSFTTTIRPLGGWPSVRGRGPDAVQLIKKIKIPNNPPTLLDLALITNLAHSHTKEQRLFRRQSWWYATVVSESLQKLASSAKVEYIVKDDELAEVHDEAAEAWKTVRVANLLPKQTAALFALYQSKKQTLLIKISQADKNWKEMVHRAADHPVQKRLTEEALKREQAALREREFALRREEDALRREQDLLKEIEELKKRVLTT